LFVSAQSQTAPSACAAPATAGRHDSAGRCAPAPAGAQNDRISPVSAGRASVRRAAPPRTRAATAAAARRKTDAAPPPPPPATRGMPAAAASSPSEKEREKMAQRTVARRSRGHVTTHTRLPHRT
jgi:hypothetical protein